MGELGGPRYRGERGGAALVVCSEECAAALESVSGLRDFEDPGAEFGDCRHCYQCGELVADPPRWCRLHGLSCPQFAFAATHYALVFSLAWRRLTVREITDEIWGLAEDDFATRPWVNPIESARRICWSLGLGGAT